MPIGFLYNSLEAQIHTIPKTWEIWISIVREKYGKCKLSRVKSFWKISHEAEMKAISKALNEWISIVGVVFKCKICQNETAFCVLSRQDLNFQIICFLFLKACLDIIHKHLAALGLNFAESFYLPIENLSNWRDRSKDLSVSDNKIFP